MLVKCCFILLIQMFCSTICILYSLLIRTDWSRIETRKFGFTSFINYLYSLYIRSLWWKAGKIYLFFFGEPLRTPHQLFQYAFMRALGCFFIYPALRIAWQCLSHSFLSCACELCLCSLFILTVETFQSAGFVFLLFLDISIVKVQNGHVCSF